MFTRRIRTLFLVLFTCVIPQAYGTSEALGLKIDWSYFNTSQTYKSQEPIVCEVITDIEYKSRNGIIESITYKPHEKKIDEESLSVFAVDTDTEEEPQGNIQFPEKRKSDNEAAEIDDKMDSAFPDSNKDVSRKFSPINRSRHIGATINSTPYNPVRNYVSCKVDDSFERQLSTDASALLDLLSNDYAKRATTCLCVALRDKYGYIKKFVFHNGASIMSPILRNKAHALGYDVIQVEQSHAEGEFIQFLLRRHQVRPGFYTHIMGIGCSRLVCAECDHLFKMFFGDNWFSKRYQWCQKKTHRQ